MKLIEDFYLWLTFFVTSQNSIQVKALDVGLRLINNSFFMIGNFSVSCRGASESNSGTLIVIITITIEKKKSLTWSTCCYCHQLYILAISNCRHLSASSTMTKYTWMKCTWILDGSSSLGLHWMSYLLYCSSSSILVQIGYFIIHNTSLNYYTFSVQ